MASRPPPGSPARGGRRRPAGASGGKVVAHRHGAGSDVVVAVVATAVSAVPAGSAGSETANSAVPSAAGSTSTAARWAVSAPRAGGVHGPAASRSIVAGALPGAVASRPVTRVAPRTDSAAPSTGWLAAPPVTLGVGPSPPRSMREPRDAVDADEADAGRFAEQHAGRAAGDPDAVRIRTADPDGAGVAVVADADRVVAQGEPDKGGVGRVAGEDDAGREAVDLQVADTCARGRRA